MSRIPRRSRLVVNPRRIIVRPRRIVADTVVAPRRFIANRRSLAVASGRLVANTFVHPGSIVVAGAFVHPGGIVTGSLLGSHVVVPCGVACNIAGRIVFGLGSIVANVAGRACVVVCAGCGVV